MIICNLKGVSCRDGPTENYHPHGSLRLNRAFTVFFFIKLDLWAENSAT